MKRQFTMAALVASFSVAGSAVALNGTQDTQMKGIGSWQTTEVFTIGEQFPTNTYTPVGILDGMGAYDMGNGIVRVYANHELNSNEGYAYTLDNGTFLKGARVSYFDFDQATRQLVDTNIAYGSIIGADGTPIDSQAKVGALGDGGGLARLCSANIVVGGTFGFVDTIFLTGEEASRANGGRGGYEYALDAATNTLYTAPSLGFAAWESVTPIATGTDDKVALLIGDDRQAAPAYLWVGEKGKDRTGADSSDFLARNGLDYGTIYAWKAEGAVARDESDPTSAGTNVNPITFNGTGNSISGSWIEITDLSSIGAQDGEAQAKGAFEFSRPEDVHTDPTSDGSVAVFTSTGRSSWLSDANGGASADFWGTTYVFDVEFDVDGNPIDSVVDIIIDGNDGNGGQFADPDFGLRSPDNLTWADDGKIYLQEDRAVGGGAFGGTSGEEASIWQYDPATELLTRVAQIDRLASLPDAQVDVFPTDLGNWESSGIIDVSELFGEAPGTLFLANTQAHGVREGTLLQNYVNADGERGTSLEEGGQLFFLQVPEPSSLALLSMGALMIARRRRG